MSSAVLLGLGLLAAASGSATPLWISDFSRPLDEQWRAESFVGHTDYRIVLHDNHPVLRADTHASASGLVRELDVDLTRTPWLNWSWRVDNHYPGIDEQSRGGDDYPARLYVVVSGGLTFWRTRAVNYVWSSNQPVGTHWSNAYTANAQMLAVASGGDGLGAWHHYRRNVRTDLERLFGDAIERIDAVALMSDSDNSGLAARAWYGPIWFSSD